MKLNRTTFFAYVRKAPFGGRLSQSQVDGLNAILDEWGKRKLSDLRWLAYMLATAYHETGARMQPVRETFATSDAQAIKRLDKAYAEGKLPQVSKPYWRPDGNGNSFFGRGLAQITHAVNYAKFGIAKTPGDALKLSVAVRILFDGMIDGKFTNRRLSDYFNDAQDDPIGARRIVNGQDKTRLIAGYHRNFLDAIKAAISTYIDDGRETDYVAPDVKPEDAKPDDVPVTQSKSLWAILTTFLSGITALPFLGNVNNGWALGAFALILVAACIGAWLVATGRVTINRSKAIT